MARSETLQSFLRHSKWFRNLHLNVKPFHFFEQLWFGYRTSFGAFLFELFKHSSIQIVKFWTLCCPAYTHPVKCIRWSYELIKFTFLSNNIMHCLISEIKFQWKLSNWFPFFGTFNNLQFRSTWQNNSFFFSLLHWVPTFQHNLEVWTPTELIWNKASPTWKVQPQHNLFQEKLKKILDKWQSLEFGKRGGRVFGISTLHWIKSNGIVWLVDWCYTFNPFRTIFRNPLTRKM